MASEPKVSARVTEFYTSQGFCPPCGGTGRQTRGNVEPETFDVAIDFSLVDCPVCSGTGKLVAEPTEEAEG